MPEQKQNTSFEFTPNKIRVLEVVAEKKSEHCAPWVYSHAPFQCSLVNQPVGLRYTTFFLKKVEELKSRQKLTTATQLLCSSAWAIELLEHKVITQEMFETSDPVVAGAGRGLTSMIVLKNQAIVLANVPVTLTLLFVDCFSYNQFEFIDANNITL